VRHCGINYTEAWDMPVSVRRWWIERWRKDGPDQTQAVPTVVRKK
jgi:hypothetical protein